MVDFEKDLLIECYTNLRNIRDTRLKFFSIFSAAAGAALFFSIRETHAFLMILCSLIIIVHIVGDMLIRKYERFYLVLSYVLEKKNDISLGISRSYVALSEGESKRISSKIGDVVSAEDANSIRELRKTIPHYWSMGTFTAHLIGFLASILVFIMGLMLNMYAGWELIS